MPIQPTVYVVQEHPTKSVFKAKKFGKLKSIFDQRYQVYIDSCAAVDIADVALEDFRGKDYLLLIGDPILIGVCFAIVSAKTPAVQVLKWDNKYKDYWPITIDFRKTFNYEEAEESQVEA